MKTGDIWSRDLFNKADDGAWHEDSKEHVATRMTDYSGVQVRDDPNDNATNGENCNDTPRVIKHVFGIDRVLPLRYSLLPFSFLFFSGRAQGLAFI